MGSFRLWNSISSLIPCHPVVVPIMELPDVAVIANVPRAAVA
jgi:hypothetical protein